MKKVIESCMGGKGIRVRVNVIQAARREAWADYEDTPEYDGLEMAVLMTFPDYDEWKFSEFQEDLAMIGYDSSSNDRRMANKMQWYEEFRNGKYCARLINRANKMIKKQFIG